MEESTKWVAARELSHRGLGQPHDAALPSESDTAVLGVYFEKITSLELPKVLAENTNKASNLDLQLEVRASIIASGTPSVFIGKTWVSPAFSYEINSQVCKIDKIEFGTALPTCFVPVPTRDTDDLFMVVELVGSTAVNGMIKRASLGWTAFPLVSDHLDLEYAANKHSRSQRRPSKHKKGKGKGKGKEREGNQPNSEGVGADDDGGAADDFAKEGKSSKHRSAGNVDADDGEGDAEHNFSSADSGSASDDDDDDDDDYVDEEDDDEVIIEEVLREGSPRSLVAFADPVPIIIDKRTKPKKTRITFSQKIEPKLNALCGLVGEGKIVGDHDPIPGRATESKTKTLTSVTESQNELRRMPTTSYSIGQFSIDAFSDLAGFEKGLLDNLVKHEPDVDVATGDTKGTGEKVAKSTKGAKSAKEGDGDDSGDDGEGGDDEGGGGGSKDSMPSNSQAQITERRLMVAIHNGARFVTNPEYHSLHYNSAKKGKGKDTLNFKGTVVLPEVPVHPAYALVLLLEYRVKVPVVIGSRGAHSSKSLHLSKSLSASNTLRQLSETVDMREETVAVRWIPIIPAAFGAGASAGPVRVEVPMLGGPVSTPEGSLIYAAIAGNVNARFSLQSSGGAAAASAAAALAARYAQQNESPYDSFWDSGAVLTMAGKESVEVDTRASPKGAPPIHNVNLGSPFPEEGAADGMCSIQEDDSPHVLEVTDHVPLPVYSTIGDLTGVVSRAVQAKLYTARFPNLIHEDELPGATEVETMQTMPGAGYLDLHKEATDDRQGNKLSFQFLAYTHLVQGPAGAALQLTPASLFFTFRFSRFPSYRSRNMRLGHGDEAGVNMVDGETRVFYDDEKPGFSVCYSTASMLSAGVSTATAFAKHLGARSLTIEIWDSETLLLVGTAGLALAQLLRGGERAIQAVVQLPVLKATVTREVGRPMADSVGVAGYGGEPSEALAPPQVGTLIMRIANVGQVCSGVTPSDGLTIEGIASNAVSIQMDMNARKGEDQTLKSTGKLMSDRNPGLAQSIRAIKGAVRDESRKLSRFETIRKTTPRRKGAFDASLTAQSGIDSPDNTLRDTSVNWLLSTGGQGVQSYTSASLMQDGGSTINSAEASLHTRKFPHAENRGPRRLEKPISSAIAEMVHTQKAVHEFRQAHKQQRITSLLQRSITTSQSVLVSFGTPTFVEFKFKNILREDGTFKIQLDDREMRLVKDVAEWRDFKSRLRTTGPIEEDMFQKSETGGHVLFLKAEESAVLPFVLRPLWSEVGPRAFRHQRDRYGSVVTELTPEDTALLAQTRTVTMRVLADSGASMGQTVAILNLEVKPLPFRVDRVFRFWHKQHERIDKEVFFKAESGFVFHSGGGGGGGNFDEDETTNVDPTARDTGETHGHHHHHHHHSHERADSEGGGGSTAADAASVAEGLDDASRSGFSAQCSSQHVACEVVTRSRRTYIRIKALMGRAPTIDTFYVALFDDKFKTTPVEIWQVYLHAVEEVHLTSTLGSDTTAVINMEGTQKPSLVQCYSSDPHILSLKSPHGKFRLGADTHTRAVLSYRPALQGTARHILHVVDVDYQRLVAAYLVVARVDSPRTTREYAITVPFNKAVSKFVKLENAYPTKRTYSIYTDRPDMIKVVHPTLTLEGGESEKITMRFREMRHNAEVYVFINNEHDGKAEECFLIKATVSHIAGAK